jgi:hypothetical protein
MTNSPDWLPDGIDEFIVPRAVFLKMTNQISNLQRENESLKQYYKDWRAQQDVVGKLRQALEPFAKLAELGAVDRAYEYGKWVELIISFDPPKCRPQIVRPDIFIEAAYIHKKTALRNPA